MATITIFADAADGTVNSSAATYASARGGAGLNVIGFLKAGQENNTFGGTFEVWEGFVSFDTSSVVVPTAVTLSLYGLSVINFPAFTVEARLSDWGAAIETGDFIPGANLGALTELATFGTVGFVNEAYNDFTSTGSNFVNNLNLSGFTRMVLASNQTRLGNSPPDIETATFYDVESGTDPKLVITTSQGVSSDSILEPTADITIDAWTTDLGGTTNLWQSIDESSPSDTDFIRSPAAPISSNVYEALLEIGTDPGVNTGHILHYRIDKNVAGGSADVTVGLYQGTTLIEQFVHTNITNTFTTFNQALNAANVANITNYGNLRIRFTPSTVTSDIAPTFVADRATANSNAAVTTVDLALAGMTIGNYLIIRTAADNSGGGGAARTITLTNQVGTPVDTATDQAFQQNNDPGAASAGTTCNFLIAKITATSGTVRLTYSGTVVQACVAEEWSGIHATTPVVGSPVGANATASTALPALTDASVAVGNVVYAAVANEGPTADVYTADADTVNGSWVTRTKLGTSNATADLNQTIYAAQKTVTATGGQTHNGTRNNARDSAGLIVELAGAPSIRVQCSWANLELPAAVMKLQSKLSKKVGQAIKTGAMS